MEKALPEHFDATSIDMRVRVRERDRERERMAGGGEANELVQAQGHVLNYSFQYVNSLTLKCAIQLRIPDAIHSHGRPMTLPELVAALGIPPHRTAALGRLMRLLVYAGFFALQKIKGGNEGGKEEEEQGYVLTPPSKLLLTGTETDMSPFLLMMVEPVQMDPLHCLSTWFKGSDRTAFEIANGARLWELGSKDPKLNDMFNDAMGSDARLAMAIVVKECAEVFHGLRSLVDVGGGNGAAAEIIANAFPHLKCSVFDLPHVVESAPKRQNVHFVGGDMYESIPSADALFLKWNLHGLNDEESVKILRRCKEAIPSREEGGKVIILEIVVNNTNGDPKALETQLFLDMMMLIATPGRERDENEWRKLFADAGFTDCKITPVLGLRSIIEVYP